MLSAVCRRGAAAAGCRVPLITESGLYEHGGEPPTLSLCFPALSKTNLEGCYSLPKG